MPELDEGAVADQQDNSGIQDAANPNDLGTELTPAEEAAFVDRQLGITDPGKPFVYGVDANEGKDDKTNADDKFKNIGGGKDELPEGDKGTGADDKGTGKTGEEEQPVAPEKPVEKQETVEQPTAPDLTDVFLEITDANGKEHKIGPNDPLPEDFQFINDAQLAEFAEARLEMKGIVRERQAEFEKQQAEVDKKTTAAESEQAQYNAWDAEIADLVSAGAITAPKAKPGDANFLEDAGVKQVDAVFKFMKTQNNARIADGKSPITSFGTAFTLYKTEQDKQAAEDKTKQDNEIAKRRGALVGGSSSGGSGGANDNLYKQGSAGSIHDLDLSDLL